MYRRHGHAEAPGTVAAMGNRQWRPDPKTTKVVVGALLTGVFTALTWLSQYSSGPLKVWQLPALSGAALLAGWIVISQSGAASKRASILVLGCP